MSYRAAPIAMPAHALTGATPARVICQHDYILPAFGTASASMKSFPAYFVAFHDVAFPVSDFVELRQQMRHQTRRDAMMAEARLSDFAAAIIAGRGHSLSSISPAA